MGHRRRRGRPRGHGPPSGRSLQLLVPPPGAPLVQHDHRVQRRPAAAGDLPRLRLRAARPRTARAVIVAWVTGRTTVAGFTTVASMVALFSGAQMLAIGVLGEYLGRCTSARWAARRTSWARTCAAAPPQTRSPTSRPAASRSRRAARSPCRVEEPVDGRLLVGELLHGVRREVARATGHAIDVRPPHALVPEPPGVGRGGCGEEPARLRPAGPGLRNSRCALRQRSPTAPGLSVLLRRRKGEVLLENLPSP